MRFKIIIDDIEHIVEDLTDMAKRSLHFAIFVDSMNKLKSEIAVYQTARNTHVTALKSELD